MWKSSAPRPANARRLVTGDVGLMTVVRHRSRESGASVPGDRMMTPRSLSSSPRPPDLTPRVPGEKTTWQRVSSTDTCSAESEAFRHSVAVREAVGVGGIHRGAMGKPSGINTIQK